MNDPADTPQRPAFNSPASLPDIDRPPLETVLESVPSTEDVVRNAQSVEEIVRQQPSVDELLGRNR
jgi:hypothetical protein